eukprot:NODE_1803_length_1402_cov_24.585366_g1631_i0.p1 GENE.NODE_1803_length_1402_cov_24.585366_g1631_i0~~NODE_1803_length_1402_cov_24.585366_g1631_i0.p1  ORF type:complete len:413 (+),score=64.23 NODE_1803_length_1402_cov_24.585366_g1631_i0:82-1320(+)
MLSNRAETQPILPRKRGSGGLSFSRVIPSAKSLPLVLRQRGRTLFFPVDLPKRSAPLTRLRGILTLLAVSVMVFSTIAVSEIAQELETEYFKPFMLTWSVSLGYSIWMVVWLIWRYFIYEPQHSDASSDFEDETQGPEGAFPWAYYVPIAFCFTVIISGMRYSFMMSIHGTSVQANTVISQSVSVFVYLFAVPLLNESVSWMKTVSVLLSLAGVAQVILTTSRGSGESSGQGSFSAYVALIISVMATALFEVASKRWGQSEEDPQALPNCVRLLGLMGMTSTALFPVPFLLNYTGIEVFEFPGPFTQKLLTLVCIDGCYLFSVIACVALTSPLFTAVASILSIPVSVLSDYILHSYLMAPAAFMGMLLILVGFFGINAVEYWERAENAAHHQTGQASAGRARHVELEDSFES